MTINPSRHRVLRRGATLVECAIVLPVLLVLLFTMLDLSIAVMNYNSLSEAARRVAREAIVRGEMSLQSRERGPSPINGTVADETGFAAVARPVLIAMPHEEVALQLDWLDGDNQVNSRVQVRVAYDYHPFFTFGTGVASIPLTATSIMRINH